MPSRKRKHAVAAQPQTWEQIAEALQSAGQARRSAAKAVDDAAIAIGRALWAAIERKLYKGTWESFCEQFAGCNASQAHEYITRYKQSAAFEADQQQAAQDDATAADGTAPTANRPD
jgi:hypothetical protein